MVPLAAKMWLLNTPLWVLSLQCPTSSFSYSPDAANQTQPISADPRGLKCFTRAREQVGKGTLVPCRHPAGATGGSLFSRQTYKALPTAACCCTGHHPQQFNGNQFECDELGLSLNIRRWSKSSRIDCPLSYLRRDILHSFLVRRFAAEDGFCTTGAVLLKNTYFQLWNWENVLKLKIIYQTPLSLPDSYCSPRNTSGPCLCFAN